MTKLNGKKIFLGVGTALVVAGSGYFFVHSDDSENLINQKRTNGVFVQQPLQTVTPPVPTAQDSKPTAETVDSTDFTELHEVIAEIKSHDDGSMIFFTPEQEDQFVKLLRSAIAKAGIKAVPILAASVKPTDSNLGPVGQVVARAIAESYLDPSGNLGNLKNILNLCKYDGPYAGLLLYKISERLVTEAQPSKAFQDILTNGVPENVPALFYGEGIARNTGARLGYQKTLELIPNPRDGGFGTASSTALFTSWLSLAPEEASTFIRDMPESPLKTSGIVHMARYLADTGDIDGAQIWARTLPPKDSDKVTQYIDQAKLRGAQ